jgi:hypothetical protein
LHGLEPGLVEIHVQGAVPHLIKSEHAGVDELRGENVQLGDLQDDLVDDEGKPWEGDGQRREQGKGVKRVEQAPEVGERGGPRR